MNLIIDLRENYLAEAETAAGSGGRVFLYPPPRRPRPLCLRQLAEIATRHGKTVAVAIDRGRPHAVFADDFADERSPAAPLKHAVADVAARITPPVTDISKLPPRAAGSTDVFVLRPRPETPARAPAELCAAVLAAPDILDMHVHAAGFYLLRTKASKLTSSIDQLLKSNRIRPWRRRRFPTPRAAGKAR